MKLNIHHPPNERTTVSTLKQQRALGQRVLAHSAALTYVRPSTPSNNLAAMSALGKDYDTAIHRRRWLSSTTDVPHALIANGSRWLGYNWQSGIISKQIARQASELDLGWVEHHAHGSTDCLGLRRDKRGRPEGGRGETVGWTTEERVANTRVPPQQEPQYCERMQEETRTLISNDFKARQIRGHDMSLLAKKLYTPPPPSIMTKSDPDFVRLVQRRSFKQLPPS